MQLVGFFEIKAALGPAPAAPAVPLPAVPPPLWAPDWAYQARVSWGGRTAYVMWGSRFITGIRPFRTVGGAWEVRAKAHPSLPEALSSGWVWLAGKPGMQARTWFAGLEPGRGADGEALGQLVGQRLLIGQ